jgi:hypothetical protein
MNAGGYIMPPPVFGAIGDRYNELIRNGQNWMGVPVTEEMPFVDGGRVQNFERGSIYWWPDVGAIELGLVALRYKGLYCWSTTDGFGPDEPYITIGIAPPPGMPPFHMRSNIYEDTDGGDSRPDDIELYRGLPYGVQLACGLWEHDSGDADQIAWLFKEVADGMAGKAVEACRGEGGPVVADICKRTWDGYVRDIANDLVDAIFGVGDDKITAWNWNISAKDMVRLCRQPLQNWWGIEHHMESHLLSGDGGDYKIYLEVRAV